MSDVEQRDASGQTACTPSENAPFFIVGCGRSGTTLLRSILCEHSRIHIPPETWFLLPLLERFSTEACLSRAEAEEALRIITGHFRWQDFGLDETELRRRAGRLASTSLRDVVDLVFAMMLEKSGKPRLGEKTPLYVGIVPEIARLYPQAKFILLIRDGRDVAISFIEANFSERCYDRADFEWIAAARKTLAYRNSPIADRILEVRYDELVRLAGPTMRRICKFLGEAFEPQMLEHRDRRDLVPERGHQLHANLARPISDHSVGVWQRKLSGPQCFAMEACMRRELMRMGYALRFGAAGWRPLLAASERLLRAMAPLLSRGIPALQRRGLLRRPFYL